MRHLCYFLYITFFRFTPERFRPYALFFPRLRRFLVSHFVDDCGSHIVVKHNADISPHIKIGARSELGQGCVIYGGTELGSDVLMGPGVRIITRNHNYNDLSRPINVQGERFAPVVIGDDVWIGANVVILPGVLVGSHSVIGAGSIVTKSIPEYSIAGGNPARVIRRREVREHAAVTGLDTANGIN